jgi:hypothetical protein
VHRFPADKRFISSSKRPHCFFDPHVTVHRYCILLGTPNKMQRFTIFFITVNALHGSGGFSAQHHELKTVHTASGKCQACLLLPPALTVIKNIVKRCILLVVPKRIVQTAV